MSLSAIAKMLPCVGEDVPAKGPARRFCSRLAVAACLTAVAVLGARKLVVAIAVALAEVAGPPLVAAVSDSLT
jgi:hypothetical protein